MPRPDDSDKRICDYAGNQCFHKRMKNVTFQESCQCLPRCDALHYSFQLESQLPIQLDTECEKSRRGFNYIKKRFQLGLEMYEASLELSKNTSLTNEDWKTIFRTGNAFIDELVVKKCREVFSTDFAMIEIKIEDESFIKMKKSLKFNTTIKLGTIGGTIGLFTGFSFMALVEIAYWFLVTCKRIMSRLFKPRPRKHLKMLA